ncbi:MAG: allophanate hydrolase [Terrimicrobiaceae bacterium]|nr:allophanate hydrolase [Terrimicrobiaceae bacterium]
MKTPNPADRIRETFRKIRETGPQPIWIHVRDEADVLAELEALDPALPLYGVPFAVKDNIDVAGIPTTAACPAFAYTPTETAPAVRRLQDAGALLIGKTNMDQFATGLVGTRTPYGICSSVFNPDYLSGGSSSGSAVAVASGLVAFALGTDTAGSGRVPAAFNGIVGLKPTRGLLSTRGVVPACRSLDCVSIFAKTTDEALTVLDIAAGHDPHDPWSRPFPTLAGRSGPVRIGIPHEDQLEFFGDDEAARIFAEGAARFEAFETVRVDISEFLEAARLLYGGAWVAERDHAFGAFLREHPEAVDPTVFRIVTGAPPRSAVDAFSGFYRLQELRKQTEPIWESIDALLLPTTPTIYRIVDVINDPITLNSRLGTYTNFVNLLDLAAIAFPGGLRRDGLPAGLTLVGPAFHDHRLATLAGFGIPDRQTIPLAVVGAHLTGQPLNGQLTERGATLLRTTTTSPDYRLHALDTVPPKPGLVRVPDGGVAIEVEVWDMPVDQFGSFVALIPPPLGIGSIQVADGSWVKGFICEPAPLEAAPDISHFGGWRNYRASL